MPTPRLIAAATAALAGAMLVGGAVPGTAIAADGTRPPAMASGRFHIQFAGDLRVPRDARVVEVDGLDTPPATIARLRESGRIVACYVSAGSWERWRADAARFPAAALGRRLDGWPGERWLDVRLPEVRTIMRERIDRVAARGCQAIEFDNVDGYANRTGFTLAAADQVAYDAGLADYASRRGLSPGLKNATGLIPRLVSHFAWALNEECVTYRECSAYTPFVRAGKPVWVLEYGEVAFDRVCRVAGALGLSAQVKRLSLDAYSRQCDPAP